ncbi:MAG: DUF3822 family protein [Saprospiraceae bacterium]|nr:DUF3822 family protein [Saprospiraceae bacterium]
MGGKIKLEISDHNFSGKISPQHELSILIGVGSLSYCIIDEQRQLLLLRDLDYSSSQALSDLFLQDEYLRQQYRSIRAGIASSIFTLIPNRLYNIAEKRAYLQQIVPIEDSVDIRTDEIPPLSVVNVYAEQRDILDIIRKYLPGSKIFHITTSILNGLLSQNTAAKGTTLFLHVHTGKLIVTLFQEKSLQFINLFNYQSAKDFLYYVMLVFDQFSLTPEEVTTYISGQLIKESEIYPLLHRYIRNLHFLPSPDFIKFGQKWKEQPGHFFFDLFSLTLCN